jgi:hypothetical protein
MARDVKGGKIDPEVMIIIAAHDEESEFMVLLKIVPWIELSDKVN